MSVKKTREIVKGVEDMDQDRAIPHVQVETTWKETNPKADFPRPCKTLISFESGHYKEGNLEWKGDSVWTHFKKPAGGMIHVNKNKVEYIETFA